MGAVPSQQLPFRSRRRGVPTSAQWRGGSRDGRVWSWFLLARPGLVRMGCGGEPESLLGGASHSPACCLPLDSSQSGILVRASTAEPFEESSMVFLTVCPLTPDHRIDRWHPNVSVHRNHLGSLQKYSLLSVIHQVCAQESVCKTSMPGDFSAH